MIILDARTTRNILLIFAFKFAWKLRERLGLHISDFCFDRVRPDAIDMYLNLMKLIGDLEETDIVQYVSYTDLLESEYDDSNNSQQELSVDLDGFNRALKNECGVVDFGVFSSWIKSNLKWFDYSDLNTQLKMRAILSIGEAGWGFKEAEIQFFELNENLKKTIVKFSDEEVRPLWNDTWKEIENIRNENKDVWDLENQIIYDSFRDFPNEPDSSVPTPVVWPYGYIANKIILREFDRKLNRLLCTLSARELKMIDLWFSKVEQREK